MLSMCPRIDAGGEPSGCSLSKGIMGLGHEIGHQTNKPATGIGTCEELLWI